MIYYKVRRKSDGAYYPWHRKTKNKMDKFYQQYGSAVDWYNGMGWDGDEQKLRERYKEKRYNHYYYKTEDAYVRYWKSVPTYADIELVKFGLTGEVVLASGVRCTLSKKEADAIEPTGIAPLTGTQKQAGIRDEIGPLLDKIDEAEAALASGKSFNSDALYAEVELKEYKLQAALEALTERHAKLREKVMNLFEL